MKIELENVLPARLRSAVLRSSQKNWETGYLIRFRSRLLSGPFIPVRILNMLIRCAFLSMRWRKRWMRYAKGLIL